MPVDVAELETVVRHLASIERASGSAGEHQAAEWIAGRLRELGYEPHVEEESVHGTYWVPLGLLSLLGALGGLAALRGRTWLGAALGASAATAIFDDIGSGRQRLRKRLTQVRTWNVWAQAGDPEAQRTVVVLAHHDAARSGMIFSPVVPETAARLAPGLLARADTSPPLLWLVFGGPALVAAGALLRRRGLVKTGTVIAAGSVVAFAQIASSPVVPGANDNLTGVATLLGVARALAEQPVEGLRVILLSCGSEESFQEGVNAYLARHGSELAPERTDALCVDTVGSPSLCVPEAEGMLVLRGYDPELKDLVTECGAELGVPITRGLKFSFSSDAAPWRRRGGRSMLLGSINEYKAPANYHWPTDHADNVIYERVADATRIVERAVRRLAGAG